MIVNTNADTTVTDVAPRPTAAESLAKLVEIRTNVDQVKAWAVAKADAIRDRIVSAGGVPSAEIQAELDALEASLTK